MEDEALERARKWLFEKRNVRHGDRTLAVACLIRGEDIRPLDGTWWRGKQVSLLGIDLNGNLFLRHSDGSVRYWDHSLQKDEIIAKSVREFVSALR